jgi:AcrR family transcriptional regulator
MPRAARSRPPRRRLNRIEREASLLDAADAIVAREGVEALTMEALAARAGVNKALGYRFFANRDEVLLALWDRETSAFDRRVREAIAPAEGLEAQLRAILDVWLDVVETGGGTLGRLDAPGVGPPALERRRRARTEGVLAFLAGLFRAEYPVSQQDALTSAAVLGSGAQGLAALQAHTGWPRRRLTTTFVRLCVGAIEAVAHGS